MTLCGVSLAKGLTIIGGILLVVGLIAALRSNRNAVMKTLPVARDAVGHGGLTENQKARAEFWFRVSLVLTALGVVLQTIGAFLSS
jgi:hypothetical protein